MTLIKGGCHCGAVRYEIAPCTVTADYCHCAICRKITGAPVSAFISVPLAAFVYTLGQPQQYASSPRGVREFCSQWAVTWFFVMWLKTLKQRFM